MFTLRDVFAEAHILREIHGETPLVTVALYRFLIALLHRVYQGKLNVAMDWHRLWSAPQSDLEEAVSVYLDELPERFDLFHPQFPFYQDSTLRDTKLSDEGQVQVQNSKQTQTKMAKAAKEEDEFRKPVTALMHEIASGNNAAWFDHTRSSDNFGIDAATAVRALLAAQCFSLSGTGASKGNNFTHGPLSNDVIFVVQGDNLRETLLLNLYLNADGELIPPRANQPIWERDSPLSGRSGAKKNIQAATGYLDFLTWPSRRILFKRDPNDGQVRWMKMDQGMTLNNDDAIKDPMKAYKAVKQKQKKGTSAEEEGKNALGWEEERALWRDSAALFQVRAKAGQSASGYAAPDMIANLNKLIVEGVLTSKSRLRCAAFGLSTSKTNVASVQFFRSETLPLPLSYLTDETGELVVQLSQVLMTTEKHGAHLVQAVRHMAQSLVTGNAEHISKEDKTAIDEGQTDLESILSAANEEQAAKVEAGQVRLDKKYSQRRGLRAQAERLFWSAAGESFYETLLELGNLSPKDLDAQTELLSNWEKSMKRLKWRTYEEVATNIGRGARALQAYAEGLRILSGKYLSTRSASLPKPKAN
jgi:CRISPR system Cascade subunit CasA